MVYGNPPLRERLSACVRAYLFHALIHPASMGVETWRPGRSALRSESCAELRFLHDAHSQDMICERLVYQENMPLRGNV